MLKEVLTLQLIDVNRALTKGKKNKVIGVMKDELVGKIMSEFIGLRAKAYSYLIDNNDEDKRAKNPKMCVMKRKIKLEDYKNCLEATQLDNRIKDLKKMKLTYIVLKKIIKDLIKNKKR